MSDKLICYSNLLKEGRTHWRGGWRGKTEGMEERERR